MLAFSIDYYGMIFRATQSVELFCAYYKTAIAKNRPCGILLADGIVNWHWILGVGWREYSSGNFYMRIVDGWDGTSNRFYKPYSDSLWVSATEYWL